MGWIDKLVESCLNKGIITSENKDWFRYGIEKRFTTICVGVPFFVLAVLMSGFWMAVFFFFSFFFLRSRTNGYHAQSILQCLFVSLGLELVLLGLIKPLLNNIAMGITMVIVLVLIIILAPYNHPNIALTREEVAVCKKSSRIRISLLSLCFVLAQIMECFQIAAGITLGSAMAGGLLCFAYISEWRINHGKCADKSKQNA